MPKRKKTPPLEILVDTREQLPYLFEDYNCIIERKGLKTGDYSISGLEDKVAVERKTKADLYNSLGKGRKRFKKEFERLSGFKYAALVIEAGIREVLNPPARSKMNPASVFESLVSWSMKYGVYVYFGDDRYFSEKLVYSILEKFRRYC